MPSRSLAEWIAFFRILDGELEEEAAPRRQTSEDMEDAMARAFGVTTTERRSP